MRKMHIILIIIIIFGFCFFPVFSESQSDKQLSNSATEEFVSYEEQFIDNTGGWEIFDTTMATTRIDEGKYYIENKSETGELYILHHADFPLGREFVIEIAIKTVTASENHSYGFVIGASDASNNYVFQIIGDKAYSIVKVLEGDFQELSGAKIRSRVLKSDSFNTLKLEKLGTKIRFYINNHYIDEVSNISLFGKRVGFHVEGKSEIAVDYTRSQIWPD